ncbi:MAG: pyridoxamine 5'-phosphate oxidase family protein [Pseudodesulfovibrio sp.]
MRKGVTDNQDVIKDVLDRAEVLWLAFADDEGPHSVPVNFAYTDGKIYIHTGKKGRKADAFNAGSPVAFSAAVDIEMRQGGGDACDQGYYFRSVMGRGTPRLTDGDEKMLGLNAITVKHLGKQLPYKEKMLPMTLVYAIDIENIKGRIKEG